MFGTLPLEISNEKKNRASLFTLGNSENLCNTSRKLQDQESRPQKISHDLFLIPLGVLLLFYENP